MEQNIAAGMRLKIEAGRCFSPLHRNIENWRPEPSNCFAINHPNQLIKISSSMRMDVCVAAFSGEWK
jgi:hypothetical protein